MTVCLSFLSWPGLSERPVSAGAGRAVCCGAPLPGRQVPLPVASPAGTVQGFRNGVRKELQLLLRDTIITSDPVAGDGRMSARYTITPVSVGTSVVDRSQMVWGQGYGTKMQVPVMMFYVEGNGRRVLFDTGCPNPESAAKYHYPCVRKSGEEPAQALEAIGFTRRKLTRSSLRIFTGTTATTTSCSRTPVFWFRGLSFSLRLLLSPSSPTPTRLRPRG